MKIRTKAFLMFQIAVAIVTAIVSFIAFLLLQCITGELRNIDIVDAVFVLFMVILFAVISGFSWKVWNGKSTATFCGYNILVFFAIGLIAFIVGWLSSYVLSTILTWVVLLFYVFLLPVNLFLSLIIGVIGKYFVNKYKSRSSL